MPDALAAALADPGLPWLLVAILAAGLVYGFAGFGSALVFLPVGAAILPPADAVAAFSVAGLGSVATMLPRAWAEADRRATLWMVLAAALAMPAGIRALTQGDPVALRRAICGLVAVTLAAVATGTRLRIGSGPRPRLALGAAAGLVGGATGLLGPVVILTTLASGDGAARMRANLAAFLTILNAALLPMLALQGALAARALWTGALLLPGYALATVAGAALFRPGAERLYRGLACAVVAAAVVAGLPAFG